jgi:hypothetical protein
VSAGFSATTRPYASLISEGDDGCQSQRDHQGITRSQPHYAPPLDAGPLTPIQQSQVWRCQPTHPATKTWRRERDSNPRNGFPFSGFQDHRHRPLGHPSASNSRPEIARSAVAAPSMGAMCHPSVTSGLGAQSPTLRHCIPRGRRPVLRRVLTATGHGAHSSAWPLASIARSRRRVARRSPAARPATPGSHAAAGPDSADRREGGRRADVP